MNTTVIVLLVVLVFSVLHSLTASPKLKDWFKHQFGERVYHGWYRVAYNAFSVVTLLPVFLLIVFLPGATLWQVDNALVAIIFALLQLLGLVCLVISLLQIDWLRFAGLSQLEAYISGKALPLPDEPLQTGGLYALVRHPLYLFSLIVIWFVPTMTVALLAFNVGATLYFIIGSRIEERRMLEAYGDTYRQYQQRVPWLIPFVRF